MTLRRKKPLRAKRGLKAKRKSRPRSPIKPKKRKPSEFARIYGSKRRVEAIKALACHACHREPAENAHIESGGMGRKADWTKIVDLGRKCHRTGKKSLHNLGSVEAFDREHGTRLRERAAFLAEFLKP